jgi:hypothetical protein
MDMCRNAQGAEIFVPSLGKEPSRIFQTFDPAEIARIVACIDFVDPDVSEAPDDGFIAVARSEVCTYLLEVERADRSKIKIYVYRDFAVEPSESVHPKFAGVLSLTDRSKARLKRYLEKRRANKRPDGTSAKAPPSKPSQGAAVPHP